MTSSKQRGPAGKTEPSEACLYSLTILGRILLWTPIVVGLPAVVYTLVTGDNVGPVSSGDGAYAVGMICTSGLVALIYVSIKRFQKARRGTDE
jgi:hypothetical protein